VLQPRVIDLNNVVNGMQGILRRIIGEHIELTTILAPGLGRVKADPSQIEQAIMNLAVNARDAMPNGGNLVLETSDISLDKAGAGEEGGLPPGRYVALRVIDTGFGMTPEVLSHLYEPFFTTKEQGKGTGLGLSTVYGIVRQSSGSIEVGSAPGRGTSFRILLPRVNDMLSEIVQKGSESSHLQGSETVLVVEDEPSVLEFVAQVLTQQGYTVLRATRAVEALRILDVTKTPIHLVVTDVVMPGGMSGWDLARELLHMNPRRPVLLMSGYVAEIAKDSGPPGTPTSFLEKPFTPASLLGKVRQMLDAAKESGGISFDSATT
jgi:CheY-like chemotaxis protein